MAMPRRLAAELRESRNATCDISSNPASVLEWSCSCHLTEKQTEAREGQRWEMKLVLSVLIKSLLPRVWASGLWWDVEWCEVMGEQGIKVLRDPESHRQSCSIFTFLSILLASREESPFSCA